MKTVLLVPRRADDGHRDVLWAWCRERWEALMPDVPVVEGHHQDGPFNRAAAINRAAELAGDWDIGVVIDADVFLSIANVRAAIASAEAGKITWAHRRWRGVSEGDTSRLIKDPDTFGPDPDDARDMDLLVEKTTPISWSCCVAVPRATFEAMGGFDERFTGWGFEDGAWAALVRALYPWSRIEGDIFHWWHPRSDERIVAGQPGLTARPEYIRNALLGRRYMVAAIRDHAAGDQPGEERLDPAMVKIHVSNLTTDDAKFLALAKHHKMPEAAWEKWWPSLEELQEGARAHRLGPPPSVTLVVRTGGEAETWPERSGYLRASLASLVERISGPIVQRVIYADWAAQFRPELEVIAAEHGFYVVGEGHHGYVGGVQRLWDYLSRRAKGDYVFATEDDFLYGRDIDLVPMIETLARDRSLVQIALLRDAFYPRETEGEGILGWPLAKFTAQEQGNGHGRLEHRLFWTMNPSLFRRSVTSMPWPRKPSSERVFGDLLLRDPAARFAFWGDGQAWIRHIGEVRAVPGGAGY